MATNDEVNATNTPEVTQTWTKFAVTARKAGFREGAADGRDKVFQQSFDEGYFEGFRNGFALGKYKGALRGTSLQTSNASESDMLLENSRRGLCQICKDDHLLLTTSDEIKHIQTEFSNSVLENIHLKYSLITNVQLCNKLE